MATKHIGGVMTNGDYFVRLAGGFSFILYFVLILLWAGYQIALRP